MAKRRHWTKDDFVVTGTSPAYEEPDKSIQTMQVNRFGYCRVCKGDMQAFGGKNPGSILHYNSHGTAKRLGLWGKTVNGNRLEDIAG